MKMSYLQGMAAVIAGSNIGEVHRSVYVSRCHDYIPTLLPIKEIKVGAVTFDKGLGHRSVNVKVIFGEDNREAIVSSIVGSSEGPIYAEITFLEEKCVFERTCWEPYRVIIYFQGKTFHGSTSPRYY